MKAQLHDGLETRVAEPNTLLMIVILDAPAAEAKKAAGAIGELHFVVPNHLT